MKRIDWTRLARGLRYAFGATTKDDAHHLLWEMSHVAGSYCLVSIDAEGVYERVREEFEDGPELDAVCKDAAARVWNKWSGSDETYSSAIDWASDLVHEWAVEYDLKRLPEPGISEEEATAYNADDYARDYPNGEA